MSRKKIFVSISIVILLVVGASAEFFIANRLITSDNTSQNCRGSHDNHLVLLNGKDATPNTIVAPLCDTITFKNTDSVEVLVAFGPHEHHQSYDGVLEHGLKQNASFTITLDKAGTFYFHDHLLDIIEGQFTVTN